MDQGKQDINNNNFSTYNSFKVLRMEDQGDPMEFTVTFWNHEQNPISSLAERQSNPETF